MTDRERERLEEIFEALDHALGDTDLDWYETDEEMRAEEPVQWAAKEVSILLHQPEPEMEADHD